MSTTIDRLREQIASNRKQFSADRDRIKADKQLSEFGRAQQIKDLKSQLSGVEERINHLEQATDSRKYPAQK